MSPKPELFESARGEDVTRVQGGLDGLLAAGGATAPSREPVAPPALARRRRVLAATVAVAVLIAGLGWIASRLVASPAEVAARTQPPSPTVMTVPVDLRVLQNTLVVRGQAIPAHVFVVSPQVSGDVGNKAIVSRLPLRPGVEVRPGQLLMEVSGRPVIALVGAIPAYRDFRSGATGRDVAQLQSGLRSAGFSNSDATGTFGQSTKAAVTALYASVGYVPLPSGADDEARLTSAQAQVTASTRAVAAAKAATHQTPSLRPRPTAGAVDPELQLAYARADLATAQSALADVRATTGPMVPASEILFLPEFPAHVRAQTASLGAAVTPDAMTVSTGRLQVVSALPPDQVAQIRVGMQVQLFSEVSNRSAVGRVTSITATAPAAYPSTGGVAGADPGGMDQGTRYVVVTPTGVLPASMADQDLRVTVVAASSAGKVLVVPLSAVSAGADARTTVTVVAADASQGRVEVVTGLSGAGFVAVTPVGGDTLAPGDRVMVGALGGQPTAPIAGP